MPTFDADEWRRLASESAHDAEGWRTLAGTASRDRWVTFRAPSRPLDLKWLLWNLRSPLNADS